MVNAASFYAAVMAWLSLKGLDENYKLAGVMELHKIAGMRHYSASIIPIVPPNVPLQEPELYEKVFRNGNPEGFILVDVVTGQIYSESQLPPPSWRIQLTYITEDYDIKIKEEEQLNSRRFYDRPHVEMGSGSIKSKIVTYPPNFLQRKIKLLLSIQEKKEAEKHEG